MRLHSNRLVHPSKRWQQDSWCCFMGLLTRPSARFKFRDGSVPQLFLPTEWEVLANRRWLTQQPPTTIFLLLSFLWVDGYHSDWEFVTSDCLTKSRFRPVLVRCLVRSLSESLCPALIDSYHRNPCLLYVCLPSSGIHMLCTRRNFRPMLLFVLHANYFSEKIEMVCGTFNYWQNA